MGECFSGHLRAIQQKYHELLQDKGYLESFYKVSAEKELRISSQTLNKVKEKIGLIN